MADDKEKEVETQKTNKMKLNNGWLYGLVGVIAVALVFIAGVSAANHHSEFQMGLGGPVDANTLGQKQFVTGERGFMQMRNGGFNSVTVNGQTKTTGVVISVSGSDFTLAGNGSTTNVTTTSSTQYHGGDAVNQNDTVIVTGTTANNTLSASQIVINP